MKKSKLFSISMVLIFSLASMFIVGDLSSDTLRRVRSEGVYKHPLIISTIDHILKEERLGEADTFLLIGAKNLLSLPYPHPNFRGMQYLLHVSEYLQVKYGIRDKIINAVLKYGTPGTITAAEYVIAELLGDLPSLRNLAEVDGVYEKLFSYLNLGIAVEAIITRLSKDRNVVLTEDQVKKYIERLFENGLTVWAIAEISPDIFGMLMDLGITDRQKRTLAKEIYHLLGCTNFDYKIEAWRHKGESFGLRPYNVEMFQNLFINALALGSITSKQAESYIRDLIDKHVKRFYLAAESEDWIFMNSQENNTAVLAALTSFEQRLVEFTMSSSNKVSLDSRLLSLLKEDIENNKKLLLRLTENPDTQIKGTAIAGLVELGEDSRELFESLKLLSLVGLPPLAGLEIEQAILEVLQQAGDFLDSEHPDGDVFPAFYDVMFPALTKLLKAGVAEQEIKQYFIYIVSYFYREFHEGIRGQETLFRWRSFETNALPFIIDMAARGLLMHHLSLP